MVITPDATEEQWRPIIGFTSYDVSNLGKIRSWLRSTNGPRPFSPKLVDGYRQVSLKRDDGIRVMVKVAGLVAATWIGPRPLSMVVAHTNGVRGDDRVENLSYKTQTENWADMVRHGTAPRGERHGFAKLTEEQVKAIRAESGFQKDIASRYNVSKTAIQNIRAHTTWRFVA